MSFDPQKGPLIWTTLLASVHFFQKWSSKWFFEKRLLQTINVIWRSAVDATVDQQTLLVSYPIGDFSRFGMLWSGLSLDLKRGIRTDLRACAIGTRESQVGML